MTEKISALSQEIAQYDVKNRKDLDAFRLKFLSKKGIIGCFFSELKNTLGDKKNLGKELNILKHDANTKFRNLEKKIERQEQAQKNYDLDLTLPPVANKTGSLHPLSLIRYQIVQIFERLGFNTTEGPEIEDDWHNFSSLNFPENHPARDMQDTFFVSKNPTMLLRTHTSNVQVRLMTAQPPPIRSIVPGRVYRNETVSSRTHLFFHQVEGLYVDKQVSFVDLKQTLYHFAKEMYGQHVDIRFRPSFFPFTEPSAEIDISCLLCQGKGCAMCKRSGWVEIAGSGMIHPKVLKNCSIDPEEYQGFAFGMGVERVAQLKYGLDDIRLYSENDIRFLKQSKSIF